MKPYHQRAGWRWLPGMRWSVLRSPPLEPVTGRVGDLSLIPYPGAIPDLADPATQGAALAVLREVTDEPGLSFARAGLAGDATGGRWYMIASRRLADTTATIDAATEAEALLAALERLIPE